ECVRRLFFVIFAPDSQQESSPLSGRKSTQATVRICGASSEFSAHDRAKSMLTIREIRTPAPCWLKGSNINVLPDRLLLFSGADGDHQVGEFQVTIPGGF
ncbi:hypothetical protein, partial [Bradyrhizobium liaoningense]|uniref:hypothetical protein n=1 Tax=Bradyrhizobium liaoningense TaxID=43992 RepID=UPI0024E0C022